MIHPTAPLDSTGIEAAPHKVMIVDDAVVVRGLLSRWLGELPDFEVVASAANGRIALEALDRVTPDIILLDLDMPEMDGIEALPHLARRCPEASIVVASTLTRRNADLALRCLSLGATDCLSKPETNRDITISSSFRQELVAKLTGLGEARRRRQARLAEAQPAATGRAPAGSAAPAHPAHHGAPAIPPGPVRFRSGDRTDDIPRILAARAQGATTPWPAEIGRLAVQPRALLIGSSTGGPRAVAEVLAACTPALRDLPVIVVQHMPPIFTAVFAEHLQSRLGLRAREPFNGEQFQPGVVYVAPGGRHLRIARSEGSAVIARISDEAPVNFCRPAVDLMFRDAAEIYGPAALALVLTGMGHDGLEGARALVGKGAAVIVQDEDTSAVWGMPGSVARAGLARAVLPLERIGPAILGATGAAP